MPESAQNWKSYRTALRKHLHEMHGGAGVGVSPSLSAEELEGLHADLHIDSYMCPPHEHGVSEDPWSLGPIELKFGPDYVDQLVEMNRSAE
jgi:hypothetical protein